MANRYDITDGLNPGRNVFNLSYSKKMSGRMGYLYPMMCDEVVPGDVFDLGAEAVIRFAPLVAPVLHEIMLKADWFFVPYRILYGKSSYNEDGLTAWERFITGGFDGQDTTSRSDLGVLNMASFTRNEGGFWDHVGIPPGIALDSGNGLDAPLMFPGYAYVQIYNDYYRDPTLEQDMDKTYYASHDDLKLANWDADYFTRALPYQQKGIAPALPVSGITHAVWPTGALSSSGNMEFGDDAGALKAPYGTYTRDTLQHNNVDLSSATTFNVSDIRLAVQLQRWMERNARSGSRYVEYLRSHFNVSPRDERLDRAEYIGGLRQSIVVSEVLQTSKTESGAPQGNLAGHGIMAGSHYIGKYHVEEYGLIMCIATVIPKPAYQQGINRQWLRSSRIDFYTPEFANLSEQPIYKEEVFLNTVLNDNQGVFGYQGRYDEMRSKSDQVAGAFRSSLNFWHLGRIFVSLPPLGPQFTKVDPATLTRIFAVPSVDHLYIHWGNKIRAIRPLPEFSNPGLLDHSYGGR